MANNELYIKALDVTIRDFSGSKQQRPRVYVSPKGETVMENLFYGRRNRPVKIYRAAAQETIALMYGPNAKAHWSQHAGCSTCPCSPGFIISGATSHEHQDAHITVGLP